MSEVTETVKPAKAKKSLGFLTPVIIGAILAGLLNFFFINIYVVPSGSMEPTLSVGDYMLSIPLIDNKNAPEKGEIVVFNPPTSWGQPDGTVFVKRVIGTEGDVVECCSAKGNLIINGVETEEPFLKEGNKTNEKWSVTVPQGKVFVLGDNRFNSGDSRYHSEQFIPVERIVGQPLLNIFPFNHFHAM